MLAPAGQVCFGFVCLHSKVPAHSFDVSCDSFAKNIYFLHLDFWTMDLFFFLSKKLLIEWRCFFTKWNCCMFWHANTYAVRNLLCIHLLPFFIFSAICVIAMLPYFLHCFWALLAWFFGPNSSLLHVLMCVRLLWYHWLVFLQFSSPYFASSCAPRFLNVLFCQKQFVLWCSWIFLCDLVARVSDCFLL